MGHKLSLFSLMRAFVVSYVKRQKLIPIAAMTTTTLLEYLTQANPVLDCSKSSTGANSFNARWDRITGLEDRTDFTYETLMRSYGHILLHPIPPLPDTCPH